MTKVFTRKIGDSTITTEWVMSADGKVTQASVICFLQDKILLLSDGKHYFLPGGHPEPDESLEDAAKRETAEEASVILAKCILMGFSKITYPNNPDSYEGDVFYQARFVATCRSIDNLKKDSATKQTFKRLFVSEKEFIDLTGWSDASFLVKTAKETLRKSLKSKK